MQKRWPTSLWGSDNLQLYDIFCKRVGACADACARIVYLPHGYWEKWSCYGICMLRSSVSREKLVIYTLGTVLSLYLSYRGGAIRKLVLEYKFWPKSLMYDHSTTLKLVISGHRYPNSFQCFRYFHSLLFFLLHFFIVYLFPGWNLMVGVKRVLKRLLLMTDVSTSWADVVFKVKWQFEIQTNEVMLWSVLWLVVGKVMWLVVRVVSGDWCISIRFVSEGRRRLVSWERIRVWWRFSVENRLEGASTGWQRFNRVSIYQLSSVWR